MIDVPCKNCGKPHSTSSLWCSVWCSVEGTRGATGDDVEILDKPKLRRVKAVRLNSNKENWHERRCAN